MKPILVRYLLHLLDPEEVQRVEAQLASDPAAVQQLAELGAVLDQPYPRPGRPPTVGWRLAGALDCPQGHASAGTPCGTPKGRAWLCASRLALTGAARPSGTPGASRVRSSRGLVPGSAVVVRGDPVDLPGRLIERVGHGWWSVEVAGRIVEVSARRLTRSVVELEQEKK